MVGGEPRKSEENLEAGAAVLEDGEGPARLVSGENTARCTGGGGMKGTPEF